MWKRVMLGIGLSFVLVPFAWSEEEPVTSLKNYRGEYKLDPTGLPYRAGTEVMPGVTSLWPLPINAIVLHWANHWQGTPLLTALQSWRDGHNPVVHYAVSPSGLIYESSPLVARAVHTWGHNDKTIGIWCDTSQGWTTSLKSAVVQLVRSLCQPQPLFFMSDGTPVFQYAPITRVRRVSADPRFYSDISQGGLVAHEDLESAGVPCHPPLTIVTDFPWDWFKVQINLPPKHVTLSPGFANQSYETTYPLSARDLSAPPPVLEAGVHSYMWKHPNLSGYAAGGAISHWKIRWRYWNPGNPFFSTTPYFEKEFDSWDADLDYDGSTYWFRLNLATMTGGVPGRWSWSVQPRNSFGWGPESEKRYFDLDTPSFNLAVNLSAKLQNGSVVFYWMPGTNNAAYKYEFRLWKRDWNGAYASTATDTVVLRGYEKQRVYSIGGSIIPAAPVTDPDIYRSEITGFGRRIAGIGSGVSGPKQHALSRDGDGNDKLTPLPTSGVQIVYPDGGNLKGAVTVLWFGTAHHYRLTVTWYLNSSAGPVSTVIVTGNSYFIAADRFPGQGGYTVDLRAYDANDNPAGNDTAAFEWSP